MKTKFLLSLMMFSCVGLTACGSEGPMGPAGPVGPQGPTGEIGQTGQPGKDGVSILKIEKTAVNGLVDTYTIYYTDGTTGTFFINNGANGQNGEQGIQGVPGKDGHTPVITIGTNGNWYVDGVDSGKQAQGPKGDKGEPGKDGLNGKSAYEIYKESFPEYTKSETEWLDDLINGRLGIKEKHTVTFNTNGGTIIENSLVEHGEKVAKPQDPIKNGYTFTNWTYKGEPWSFIGYVVTEDMILDANYTENEYIVNIYSENEKSGTVSVSGTAPYKYGDSITITANPASICLFDGWYEKGTNQLVSNANTYTFTLKDNTEYYAKFVINEKVKQMGTYPQTKVDETNESSLYQSLKIKAGETPLVNNLKGWHTFDSYYQGCFECDNYYKDIQEGQDKYRALYYISTDSYQNYSLDFFKYEPIEWNVLSADGLVISKYVLDRHIYYHDSKNRTIAGKTVFPNNYEYSDIRKFINENFLNFAFTKEEINSIQTTLVDNSLTSTGDKENFGICNDTNDKLFLLSKTELYNSEYGFNKNSDRKALLTDYARCVGVDGNNECGYYWTRTPAATDSTHPYNVSFSGYIDHYTIFCDDYGVRPSFKFSI